jgi:hypothetical protein
VVRYLLVSVALFTACAEPPQPSGPNPAEVERQRQADVADERARMARANQEGANAVERRRVRREARLRREEDAVRESVKSSASSPVEPCVSKSTETDAERDLWEGARWVEANCQLQQDEPTIVCRRVCVSELPCPRFTCGQGAEQSWIDLANQIVCSGASEHKRATLVGDAPCGNSVPSMPHYPVNLGN